MSRSRLLPILLSFVVWLSIPTAARAQDSSAQIPAGFALKVVAAGFHLPMSMIPLPSGEIMVAEKGQGDGEESVALIRLVRDGQILATPVLSLSVNSFWDSGVQSIVLDPAFEQNGFFYVMYSTGSGSPGWQGETVNRIARFTYDASTSTAAPSTEMVVLDGIGWGQWHHGGGLSFGADGNLYITTGDTGTPELAQDLSSLSGKILRIRPTPNGYEVPADNPFQVVAGARPEIFAYGLRNPFRMQRAEVDDQLYLGDVGDIVWEEINRVEAGANYGWPLREGPCPKGERLPCASASPDMTDPIIGYTHPEQNWKDSNSVTAVAYCRGDELPVAYQNALFFGDYNARTLSYVAQADAANGIQLFADNIGGLVDMACRPDGFYLLNLRNGSLVLLYHTGAANQPPSASLQVNTRLGPAPMTVELDASGSTDSDDLTLQYHWDFGDGSAPVVTSSAQVVHTYGVDGTYPVTLVVEDIRGARSLPVSEPVTVYSGEIPRIELQVSGDEARTQFRGGDELVYRVLRSSGTADLDAAEPFRWQIEFVHNQHVHPIVTEEIAVGGIFTVSTDNHGGATNIAYRFILTMVTDVGQEIVVDETIAPDLASIQVDAYPVAAPLRIDGVWLQPGEQFTAVVGKHYALEATDELLFGDSIQRFAYWHLAPAVDLLAAAPPELIYGRTAQLTVPLEDAVLIAQYAYARPADKVLLPLFQR